MAGRTRGKKKKRHRYRKHHTKKRRRRKRKKTKRRKRRRSRRKRRAGNRDPAQYVDMVRFMMVKFLQYQMPPDYTLNDIENAHIGSSTLAEGIQHYLPGANDEDAGEMRNYADANEDGVISWNELLSVMEKIWTREISMYSEDTRAAMWAIFWTTFAVYWKGREEYHKFVENLCDHDPFIPEGVVPIPFNAQEYEALGIPLPAWLESVSSSNDTIPL